MATHYFSADPLVPPADWRFPPAVDAAYHAAMRALTVLLVCAPAVAWAAPHPAVSLSVDACAGVDEAQVAGQVKIELGADLAPASPEVTRVQVRCDGDALVLIVNDPITGKSLERRVDLGAAAPKARTRLLAIAISELVSASWTELETNPTPVVAPAGPPPAPSAKAAVRDTVTARTFAPHMFATLGLDFRAFPGATGTGMLVGLGARFATAGAGLGFSVDLVTSQGKGVTGALGQVSVDLVGVGAVVTYGARVGGATLAGELGLRGGSARLGGVPVDDSIEGRSVRGAFGGPIVGGSAVVRVFGPLILTLRVEGGVALASVRALADGQAATVVGGPFVGGALGLGVAL